MAVVLPDGVPGGGRARRAHSFETAYRSRPEFNPAVISLDDVVQVRLQDVRGTRRNVVEIRG
jgi:hypothetical protein